MFAVVYHWKLKDGIRAEDFYKSWHEGTLRIYTKYGSCGSSLHKLPDGTLLAYARWPNKKTWEKMMKDTSRTSNNHLFVDLIDKPTELELIDDQLKSKL